MSSVSALRRVNWVMIYMAFMAVGSLLSYVLLTAPPCPFTEEDLRLLRQLVQQDKEAAAAAAMQEGELADSAGDSTQQQADDASQEMEIAELMQQHKGSENQVCTGKNFLRLNDNSLRQLDESLRKEKVAFLESERRTPELNNKLEAAADLLGADVAANAAHNVDALPTRVDQLALPRVLSRPKASSEELARQPEMCGSWQDNYAQMHQAAMKAVIQGQDPPPGTRFVVFRCRQGPRVNNTATEMCGGLGDRFSGMVSAMAFALLTNRMFLLDWPGHEVAFTSPYIDYDYHPNVVGGPMADLSLPPMPVITEDGKDRQGELVRSADGQVALWNWHDCEIRLKKKRCGGVFAGHAHKLDVGFPEPVVIMSFNKGVTSILMEHPTAGPALRGHGLQPEFIFGCLLHFLIKPTDAVMQRFAQYSAALDSDANFVVGVHVRTGDRSLKSTPPILTLDDRDRWNVKYRDYFDCAEWVARQHRRADQQLLWFFVTDSESLREATRKEYGEKVLVTDVQPSHIDELVSGDLPHDLSAKHLQEAFGEWWLLSKCDYVVFAPKSGFSKTAYAYSLQSATAINPALMPRRVVRTLDMAHIGAGL
eukprot:jgi/Chlat1/1840/Chrsp14S02225